MTKKILPNKNFSFFLKVYYSDTDALGIVNNVKYFYFMEKARFEYWESLSLNVTNDIAQGKYKPVLVHQECNYYHSLKAGDKIKVEVKVSKIGETSLTTNYYIKKNNLLVANGKTVHVFLNKKNKKIKVPEEVVKKVVSANHIGVTNEQ